MKAPITMGPDPLREVLLPLIDKTEVSPDTKIFRFGLNNGHRLGLPVGKHISARAIINDKMVQRSYTPITSDDELGFVDLLVKVYYPNEKLGFPSGGQMSQYVDNLKIGDFCTFVGPKGRINYLRNGEFDITNEVGEIQRVSGINHIGMIAGGSGITPMLQIARDVFKNSSENTKISLLFANKSEEDILLRDEIEKMKTDHQEQFNVMFTINAAKDPNWQYKTGYINKEMIGENLPAAGSKSIVLICGPPGMIEYACLPNLIDLGHEMDRIFIY